MTISAIPNTTTTGAKEARPMRSLVYFEQAARELFDASKYYSEWRKIQNDLDGCTLKIIPAEGATPVRWIVRGMDKDTAEYYNDHIARSFQNALVGVLNVPAVTLHFEVTGEGRSTNESATED